MSGHTRAELERALALHGEGRLGEAETIYLGLLEQDPKQADALHFLGVLRHQQGDQAAAVDLIGQAVALEPARGTFQVNLGSALRAAGRVEDAAAAFRRAIELDGEVPEAHSNLGAALLELGRTEDSRAACERAVALDPDLAKAHFNLGNALHAQADPAGAADCYRRAVGLDAGLADAWDALGGALDEMGDQQGAVPAYRNAIGADPRRIEAMGRLGAALRGLGRIDEAVETLAGAARLRPDLAAPHNNLGNALREKGDLPAAVDSYRKALALDDQSLTVLANLAGCLRDLDQHQEALSVCDRILALDPENVDALNTRGVVLYARGQSEEAVTVLERAVRSDPSLPNPLVNLGTVHEDLGNYGAAEDIYRKILCRHPEHVAARANLARVMREDGREAEAREAYDRAIASAGDERPGLEIQRALSLPVILESAAHIARARADLRHGLEALKSRRPRITDPCREVNLTSFYLSYQGRNDRDFQEAIAELHLAACPSLGWTAPHCRDYRGPGKRRIRLGVASIFLRDHTIGKLIGGLLGKLPRSALEVVVIRPEGQDDPVARAIDRGADRVATFRRDLGAARRTIAELELDILFYPEIGMNPFTYFLAFSRLAPVQCVSLGHPVTSGIPNMDYFISAADLETGGAESHYSETLVRLTVPPIYFVAPPVPEHSPGRGHFGLPDGDTLYACPQSLFKFHPDFDPFLNAILEADPKARLVLIAGRHKHWETLLRKRFAASLPGKDGRLTFLPAMLLADYLALLRCADAVLDPFHFGGGNSSYEAFAMGVPVITLPSPLLRGRPTAAAYLRMGVTDLIANSAGDYVELATRLANDKAWYREMSTAIRSGGAELFEDGEVVDGFAGFFAEAAETAAAPKGAT